MNLKHNKTLAGIIFSSLVFGVLATAMSVYSITALSSFDLRSSAISPSRSANVTSNQTMNLTVGQKVEISCNGWLLQGQRKGRNNISLWCEGFPGRGGPFTSPGVSPGAAGQQNRPANPGQGRSARPTP